VECNGGGDFKIVPFPPDRKAIDIGDYYADYSAAKTLMGWSPRVTLRDGLKRTLEYFRANGDRYWE
jgi:UDP-glucose 4-epimerase